MLILGIDTTAADCAVALLENTTVLAELSVKAGRAHSEILLPTIDKLLHNTHKKISDVALIAVANGPGSFTGVRIGVSTVKGLAFGGRMPVVGVSTLWALAESQNIKNGVVCAAMDARRGNVYTATFNVQNGKVVRMTEDDLLSASAVAAMLGNTEAPIYLAGDGAPLVRAYLDKAEQTANASSVGVGVARAGLAAYIENPNDKTADVCMPQYLRATQAERERLAKQTKGEET